MPLSPQIGSQSLAEQKQSELQPVNTECLSYDIVSTLEVKEMKDSILEFVVLLFAELHKKPNIFNGNFKPLGWYNTARLNSLIALD